MFPVICVEHFFPDPQKIINYAESLEYAPAEAHQFPGVRSDTLFNIDQDLSRYVGNRILRNYYHSNNWSNYNHVNWNAEIRFHKIRPLHEDQYHIKNRLKGHNYHHELKRTNTEATREDDIFKKYADKSVNAMNKFLRELYG